MSHTEDWRMADWDRYGLESWGQRVRNEKAHVDNIYQPPRNMPRLGQKGKYEGKDATNRWWPVTITDANQDGSLKAQVHDSETPSEWPAVQPVFVRRIIPGVRADDSLPRRRRRRCEKCGGTGRTTKYYIMQQLCTLCNGQGSESHRFQVGDGAEILRSTGVWVPCIVDRVETNRYYVNYTVDDKPCHKIVMFTEVEESLRASPNRMPVFDGRRLPDYDIHRPASRAAGVYVYKAATSWTYSASPTTVLLHMVPNMKTPEGARAHKRLSADAKFTHIDNLEIGACEHVLQTFATFEEYPEYLPQMVPVDQASLPKDKSGAVPPVSYVKVTKCPLPCIDLEGILEQRRRESDGVAPLVSDKAILRLAHQMAIACVACWRSSVSHRQLNTANILVSAAARAEPLGTRGAADDALTTSFTARLKGFAEAVLCTPPPAPKPDRRSPRSPVQVPPTNQFVASCKAHPLPPDLSCMAPEILLAYQSGDDGAAVDYEAADLFSLGLVLYSCLRTGDPWGRTSGDPTQIADARYVHPPDCVSAEVQSVIRNLLLRDPVSRPRPDVLLATLAKLNAPKTDEAPPPAYRLDY